jgi:hypothetical protein
MKRSLELILIWVYKKYDDRDDESGFGAADSDLDSR